MSTCSFEPIPEKKDMIRIWSLFQTEGGKRRKHHDLQIFCSVISYAVFSGVLSTHFHVSSSSLQVSPIQAPVVLKFVLMNSCRYDGAVRIKINTVILSFYHLTPLSLSPVPPWCLWSPVLILSLCSPLPPQSSSCFHWRRSKDWSWRISILERYAHM